jgi:hypothetical protein
VLTADIGSHVDTFLELVADDHDDESAVDVVVDISGNFSNFESVILSLVSLHQCPHMRRRRVGIVDIYLPCN